MWQFEVKCCPDNTVDFLLFFCGQVMINVSELTILKIKAMEVMSFHQVSQGLRLKGS